MQLTVSFDPGEDQLAYLFFSSLAETFHDAKKALSRFSTPNSKPAISKPVEKATLPPTTEETTNAAPVVSTSFADVDVDVSEPVPAPVAPKKRGRKSKAAQTADAVNAPNEAGKPAATLDMIRDLTKEVCDKQKTGYNQVCDIVKGFGVSKWTELDEDRYDEAVAKLRGLLLGDEIPF